MRKIRAFSYHLPSDTKQAFTADLSGVVGTLEKEGIKEGDVISISAESHRPPITIDGRDQEFCHTTVHVFYWSDH